MMSNREKLADLLVDDQNKLQVRSVKDSKQEVIIPLSNPYYQEKYLKSGVDGKTNIRFVVFDCKQKFYFVIKEKYSCHLHIFKLAVYKLK